MPRAKGERRLEILKALAHMLEAPKWERITTAALAEKLDVSEAALYRHFASKAQMYEGLIEFIENSVFTLANRITQDETDGRKQCEKLTEMLLAFAEKNPGMVRVMTGDALVGEHERLQTRVNQFFDRFEATLKQSLRIAEDGDAAGRAAAILRDFHGAPVRGVGVDQEQPPVERFAGAHDELDRFHRLDCADHAGERGEHAHLRALDLFDFRILREEARIARGVGLAQVEDHELCVEADRRARHQGLAMCDAGAVHGVARGEVV